MWCEFVCVVSPVLKISVCVCLVTCSEDISLCVPCHLFWRHQFVCAVSPVLKKSVCVCRVTCSEDISLCVQCRLFWRQQFVWAVSPVLKTSVCVCRVTCSEDISLCVPCHLFWRHQFVCGVSPVLKTSVSAGLSYSDIKVSILMHIRYLNVLFFTNVSYVSNLLHIFLPHTFVHTTQSVFYTRTYSRSLVLAKC